MGCQLAMRGKIVAAMATVQSEDESYTVYDGLGRQFFAAHSRWPAPLLAQAEQQAQKQFYRAVARCTADFLETEAACWS